MLKVKPHPAYPPEEGRYLRGNDYSPVAVVIILTTDPEEIPLEIERLVRTGVETGRGSGDCANGKANNSSAKFHP